MYTNHLMNKLTYLLLPLNLLSAPLCAQTGSDAPQEPDSVQEVEVPIMTEVGTVEYKGRTITHVVYPALPKYPPLTFANEKERQQYNRLVYNVKKVLPWAKLARLTLLETYEVLQQLPDKESRKRHLDEVERGLRKQYGQQLKKMSRSQGRLLVSYRPRMQPDGLQHCQSLYGRFQGELVSRRGAALRQQSEQALRPRGRRPLHRARGADG